MPWNVYNIYRIMGKKIIKERILKRIFDLAVSSFLLLMLSPFFLLVAVLLKMEGLINPVFRGPVFFKETRVSKRKYFSLYKFRTVKHNILQLLKKGQSSITEFTVKHDKHKYLTPVGTILANIYFDEAPQLFNVLKGEMSMVGPRPHIPEHYENDLKTGMVSAKYIKAGIMGLAQASKGNVKMRSVLERMATKHSTRDKRVILMDRLYFRKYLQASAIEMLFYDIGIMLRCLRVILEAKGI